MNNIIALHGYLEEDLQDYRKASMFLAFPTCSFKCAKDLNVRPEEICQNYFNINSQVYEYDLEDLWQIYINNPITESFVLGGLEPFDSFYDLKLFLNFIRNDKLCKDDIVVYTGYYPQEIEEKLYFIKENYNNIYIKFGRYKPNQERHYDNILGISLANKEQFGLRLS